MRVVTLVSLGASAALGLAALVVARAVLPAAQARAPAAVARPVPGVPVVVASRSMRYGDRLDAAHLALVHYPADAVPEGAFNSVSAVLAQDEGGAPVALAPVAVRQPLLPAMLSGPGARPSVAAEIAEGFRAYAIRVSDVAGVGGHALPGDRVDVVLMRDLTPGGERRSYVSEVVLQNVRVLGVDLNADLNSNTPAKPSTATLEVRVEDAQKLAVAADLGKLSLALRRTGAAEIEAVTPVATRNFVGGAPFAPSSRPAPRRATPAPARMIVVVAGENDSGPVHLGRTSTPTASEARAAAPRPVSAG